MEDLSWLYADDKNYLVRVCVRVSDAVLHVPGSAIRRCRGCGLDIWYDTQQTLPALPEGKQLDAEVLLCIECTATVALNDPEPMKWTDPEST